MATAVAVRQVEDRLEPSQRRRNTSQKGRNANNKNKRRKRRNLLNLIDGWLASWMAGELNGWDGKGRSEAQERRSQSAVRV